MYIIKISASQHLFFKKNLILKIEKFTEGRRNLRMFLIKDD